jgi:hypothetical protein
MGLLNSFQNVHGSRTPAPSKTYVTPLVVDKGTVAVTTDTITFTNLEVELDGARFKQTTVLDFGNLGTAVAPGKVYGVYAVPKYNEPSSVSAAETAGLDYYVAANANSESIAYRFFPTDVDAAVAASGGLASLTSRINGGVATPGDITVYNTYYETVERFRDPRYTTQPLRPVGFDLVLGELKYIDNSAKENAFFSKTKSEFKVLTAQLGWIKTFRKVVSTAEAISKYAGYLHLIKSAKQYDTRADAGVDATGGVDVTAAIKTADEANTAYTFTASKFFAVQEYSLPSTTDMGQTFVDYAVVSWIDKQVSNFLGRINPIYLDNTSLANTVRIPNNRAYSRMTYYADPLSLARVTVGGTPGSLTLGSLAPVYDLGSL